MSDTREFRYIVTTKRRCHVCGSYAVLSRVAVATPDDARDVILAALGLSADADLPVQEPRADGSMTITLPDGTVIKIAPEGSDD